jgi:hypothetical protein
MRGEGILTRIHFKKDADVMRIGACRAAGHGWWIARYRVKFTPHDMSRARDHVSR